MFETYSVLFYLQSTTLLVLFCFPSLCLSQETNTNFSTISSLRDPNTISSPRQVFQLGFFSPPNNTNRYLAIYYAFSPETVIWIPNRERPLNDSSGHLTIASDGNLVLTNGWNETVWSTNLNGTSLRNNTSAQFQDTGNLLLKDISTGTILWESFLQPLNVLVPTMKTSDDTNTRTKVSLSSWKSQSDPGIGNYTAGLQGLQIPQLFQWQSGQPYWRSGPWNGQFFSGVETMYSPYLQVPGGQGEPTLDPQGLGVPQVHNDQNGMFYFVVPEGQFFTRLLFNTTGHLTYSAWSDQERDWTIISVTPTRQCEIYGLCGPFGSCNRFDSPICSCLTGFQPENPEQWNRGNWTGGCVRQRQLECSLNNNTSGNEDRFLRLPFMKVPDFADAVPSIQPHECSRMCLDNCSCIAYAHEPYIGCMLWQDTLIDAMAMAGVGIDLYIRLSASGLDNPQDRRLIIIIPVVVGGFAVICFGILITWCWMVKMKGRKLNDRGQKLPSNNTTIVLTDELEKVNMEELTLFTFETLANATGQFDDTNLLGTGGFGPVYKGTLQNGEEIAVKRLSAASGQGNEEFMNEMVLISKLQHMNLVRLLGCCVEREEKMLIYEYMPNKSLDGCLFDPTHLSAKILDWKRRLSIIEGIGRGIMYLHNDSRLKIIHRDLKPSNVLLDSDWNPKISDFGMARIFGRDGEHGNTARVVGTYGYMAPEYAMDGRYSEKSDIYSFGVLMLEIISGKKNTHYYNQELSSGLLECAWKMWHENNGLAFADQAISSLSFEGDIVRCINIALLCVQEFPYARPSIETVLSMLSKEIIDLPVPEEPIYPEKWNASHIGTTPTLSQLGHSVNDLTISMIDGR